MADDELNLDLTAKKKKKSKKPFDFSALEDDNNLNDDKSSSADNSTATPANNNNTNTNTMDDNVDDLILNDEIMKKKKKKKKPFNLDDLENALPTGDDKESPDGSNDKPSDSAGGSGGGGSAGQSVADLVDDFDLDFSSTKKKKKKKKTTFDLPDQDENFDKENEFDQGQQGTGGSGGGGGANDGDDLKDEFQFSNSTGTGGIGLSGSSGQSKWLDSDRDYTYDELLEMIYNKIKEKNPESESGGKKKYVLRPPQVLRIGTKKISFANFLEICRSLHRQPKHLQAFLLTELGTSGSVDANNQLIIKGRFQQKQIESVLRKYIKEYVACQTCRSPETILQKETRLFFLQCESCGSRRSVANIKSGFQAVTGRRAAMRARTN